MRVKLYAERNNRLAIKTGHMLRLQRKTIAPSENAQLVRCDEGYDAMLEVEVQEAHLQAKTVSPSEQAQKITADSGFLAMKEVNVEAAPLKEITVKSRVGTEGTHLSGGGLFTEGYIPIDCYGFSKVTVEPVKLQRITITPTEERQYIKPEGDSEGFISITVEAARLTHKITRID